MSKYTLKSWTGHYWKQGSGFTAATLCEASKLTAEDVTCIRNLGFTGMTDVVNENKSFAVNYIRTEDLDGGDVCENGNNPSKRRFATFDEAFQHGTRLREREDSKNHLGFYVTASTDEVNAEINWKTGLTNSL